MADWQDANPMRSQEARDDLRERVMDGLASGLAKGAIRHELVLGLLDLADELTAMLADERKAREAAEAKLATVLDRVREMVGRAEYHVDATCQGEAQRYARWLREAVPEAFKE